MILSLVDPTAPFVPISCNDDTITAICFAPRCNEVSSSASCCSYHSSSFSCFDVQRRLLSRLVHHLCVFVPLSMAANYESSVLLEELFKFVLIFPYAFVLAEYFWNNCVV